MEGEKEKIKERGIERLEKVEREKKRKIMMRVHSMPHHEVLVN